jgi:hypothetical protein
MFYALQNARDALEFRTSRQKILYFLADGYSMYLFSKGYGKISQEEIMWAQKQSPNFIGN